MSGSYEMLSRVGLSHDRPAFGVGAVSIDGEEVPIREETVLDLPFGSLIRFAKDVDRSQPKVLLVAPLSGHFATLLRNTIRTMSVDNDVYITDWRNSRDVSLAHGGFGFDDYTEYLIRFLAAIGPGAHMMAVCQPCVAAVSAVAVLAEAKDPTTPRTLTLMAGPIDARVRPTRVNELATSRPLGFFEHTMLATVPYRYPGRGRRVYPGFLQLGAFVSLNPSRHLKKHYELYGDLVKGAYERADETKTFYDEYFAVLDMPAEFYLETVTKVFQRFDLARGELDYRGRRVDPRAIRIPLLTIEGERDDICSPGQTMAAHDICSGVPKGKRSHHLQAGVGHYGVFSGSRWEQEIYPAIRRVIQQHD